MKQINMLEINEKSIIFSKMDTYICKGIAILFMVLHHCVGLFYNAFNLSWYAQNCNNILGLFTVFLSTSGKVCVSLLTILSGFGLVKSYERTRSHSFTGVIRFVVSHLVQFYSIFWVISIITIIPRLGGVDEIINFYTVRGLKFSCMITVPLDFLGISRLIGTPQALGDWYVSAIVMFYILFPFLNGFVKKNKFLCLFVVTLPLIVQFIMGGIKADFFIYYLPEFVTGIIFARENVLDRIKTFFFYNEKKIFVFLTIILFCSIFIMRLIFSLIVDYFFAISIIFLEISIISNIKGINKILEFLGIHSANIWLLHGVIISYVRLPVFYRYPVVLIVSLMISVIIEKMKEVTKYNSMVAIIREKIGGTLC